MLSGPSVSHRRLNVGRDFADVFREARHGFSAMRFVLDAVDANEGIRAGFTATALRGESRDGIEPHDRRSTTMMG